MNRRDLILGSAFSLAAAGASSRAQTPRVPVTGGSPASGPGGIYIPTNYGQVAEIHFTTSTDLNAFMPPGLTAIDPHRGFIKAERIKIRSPEADKTTAAFTQYDQVCITTMAATPQFGVRHRHILMWADRPWAVSGKELGIKRWGDVQFPEIFEIDHEIVAKGGVVPFHVDVWQNNNSLMSFAGEFDGKQRIEHLPYPGFYVGGDPGQDLAVMDLVVSEFSRPLHGGGTLRFGAPPNLLSDRKVAPGGTAPFEQSGPPGPGKNWSAALLKDIEVQGAIFQDFSFTPVSEAQFPIVRKALPGNGRSRL
jgi:hypothetical protein